MLLFPSKNAYHLYLDYMCEEQVLMAYGLRPMALLLVVVVVEIKLGVNWIDHNVICNTLIRLLLTTSAACCSTSRSMVNGDVCIIN